MSQWCHRGHLGPWCVHNAFFFFLTESLGFKLEAMSGRLKNSSYYQVALWVFLCCFNCVKVMQGGKGKAGKGERPDGLKVQTSWCIYLQRWGGEWEQVWRWEGMSGDQDWHEKVCRHMADGSRMAGPGSQKLETGTGSRDREPCQADETNQQKCRYSKLHCAIFTLYAKSLDKSIHRLYTP